VRFAIAVASETRGAFDPTVDSVPSADHAVSFRDVSIDPDRPVVTVARSLGMDLGAVAKGLAIDMAARELRPLANFAVDAGGDLYLAGHGPTGAPWSVGIRHPRDDGQWVASFQARDEAVCTSGDYERSRPGGDGHHIIDPRSGSSARDVTSATVVAPTAMVADALATAAFVLGPAEGLRLLERQGVEGVLLSSTMTRHATARFADG
jgi:thiamine biosynthesis lipoprotein